MFPQADIFPIQLVLMKPVLSGHWSRKNRLKCLMVIEDILRRKGSDTQCMLLSGEKCLYQAGRSQWLGKQWIVWASNDAFGLWGEAGGDWGVNCKNGGKKKLLRMMHMGYHEWTTMFTKKKSTLNNFIPRASYLINVFNYLMQSLHF